MKNLYVCALNPMKIPFLGSSWLPYLLYMKIDTSHLCQVTLEAMCEPQAVCDNLSRKKPRRERLFCHVNPWRI